MCKDIQQQWVDAKNHSQKALEAKLWKEQLLQDLNPTSKDSGKNEQKTDDMDGAVEEQKYRLLKMVCQSHSFVSICVVVADPRSNTLCVHSHNGEFGTSGGGNATISRTKNRSAFEK